MENLIDKLLTAQKKAMENRPKIGGFPYLAEVLRQAGVKKNIWYLPSCQSIYVFNEGSLIQQGTPIINGLMNVPAFDKEKLIQAIRIDQSKKSNFSDFLNSIWKAGVTWYEVDFDKRTVIYGNATGQSYLESYPIVSVK